jgi:hypothetical protein
LVRGQTFDLEQSREQVADLTGLWAFHPGDNPQRAAAQPGPAPSGHPARRGAVAPPSAPLVEARQLPPGILDLTQSWRVHEGDDAAWSDPEFDDSDWPLESLASRPASEPGWRWFRLSIRLPEHFAPPLGLLLDGRHGAYELYINGKRVPGASFESSLLVTDPRDRSFPLSGHSAVVHFALRVHLTKRLFERAPVFRSAALGPAAAIAARLLADDNERLMGVLPSLAINLALVLAGIGALGLYIAQKRRGEYLWLGVYLAALGGGAAAFGLYYSSFVPVSVNWIFAIPVNYAATLALVEFIFRFAGRCVTRPWRVYQAVLVAAGVGLPWFVWFGILGYGPYNVIEALAIAPASVLLTVLLLRWYMAGNREAGWLILPTLFPTTTLALWDTGVVMQYFGLPIADRLMRPIAVGPLSIEWFDVADAVFLLAIGVVMFFRFTRVSQEQARAGAELEAAQRVQSLLLLAQQSTASCFHIQTVYRPAQEVGGDFFHTAQIDQFSRIVVGDVSGKGLGAAMLVSALIGALDSIREASPAAVLQALNPLLVARQEGGFATCICGCVSPDGVLTLANAGHLAPYRNGEELPVDNGLPLGVAADAHYSESTWHLSPDETLTFLSDGVVEARNPHGELFGFDRTRKISSHSAGEIAAAAQAFGQEDDITVLTLTFAPAEVLHA